MVREQKHTAALRRRGSRCDPSGVQIEAVKIGQRHGQATAHKFLCDGDAPFRRDAALPPFQAGLLFGVEVGGDLIDELPIQRGFGHSAMIGQIVQEVKPTVSKDTWTRWRHIRRMPGNEEAMFNEDLVKRTHRLRRERGWTAEQMATALGVPPDRYRKYEYRTPLPHYLIERFALIVGRDPEYILLGKTGSTRSQSAEKGAKLA